MRHKNEMLRTAFHLAGGTTVVPPARWNAARWNAVFAITVVAMFIYAQTAHALTIGPSRFEVSLPPGEVAGADYYVQNETDKPAHISVEPENWFKDAYSYNGLAIEDWISLDSYEFDLEPKEIKKLKLTITVPKDRTDELVAQIFFTSTVGKAEGEAGPGGSGVRARLGAVLYVAIKGAEKVEAEIRNIDITKVTEDGEKKLKIGVTVRNKGNVHLRPAGKVLIETKKGEKIAELDLKSGKAVLPGQEQAYYAAWNESKPGKGKYRASATVDYGKIFAYEKPLDLGKRIDSKRAFEINKEGEVVLK